LFPTSSLSGFRPLAFRQTSQCDERTDRQTHGIATQKSRALLACGRVMIILQKSDEDNIL